MSATTHSNRLLQALIAIPGLWVLATATWAADPTPRTVRGDNLEMRAAEGIGAATTTDIDALAHARWVRATRIVAREIGPQAQARSEFIASRVAARHRDQLEVRMADRLAVHSVTRPAATAGLPENSSPAPLAPARNTRPADQDTPGPLAGTR